MGRGGARGERVEEIICATYVLLVVSFRSRVVRPSMSDEKHEKTNKTKNTKNKPSSTFRFRGRAR